MRRYFRSGLGLSIGCLVLLLAGVSGMGIEFSLDDNPSPPGPIAAGTPPLPPYQGAEDEFGLGLPASVNGFVGPSPFLYSWGWDSFLFACPGPITIGALLPYHYADSFSTDHNPWDNSLIHLINPLIWLHFSVDRATGGLNGGDRTWQQASLGEQPGDIFQGARPFQHPGYFAGRRCGGTPLGGILPTAGTGGTNRLILDHRYFGLQPSLPNQPVTPGSHDNIDGYNADPPYVNNGPVYFTVHFAEYILGSGFPGAADIMVQISLAPLVTQRYAAASQIGLDPDGDSIDALIVWDKNDPLTADPDEPDYALFSLAPGSQTLYYLYFLGYQVDAGTIFFTSFNGCFFIYAYSSDIGVGPYPIPPLPANPPINPEDVNVDALERSVSAWPEWQGDSTL